MPVLSVRLLFTSALFIALTNMITLHWIDYLEEVYSKDFIEERYSQSGPILFSCHLMKYRFGICMVLSLRIKIYYSHAVYSHAFVQFGLINIWSDMISACKGLYFITTDKICVNHKNRLIENYSFPPTQLRLFPNSVGTPTLLFSSESSIKY